MYKILIVDDEKMIRMGMKNAIDWMKIGIDEVRQRLEMKRWKF